MKKKTILLTLTTLILLSGFKIISDCKVNDHYIEFPNGTGYYSETPIFTIF